MDDISENINECSPNKKRKGKILIVFDDMVPDMLSYKKLNPEITKLFITGRKLNISVVFIYTILFCCAKIFWTKFYSLFHYRSFK